MKYQIHQCKAEKYRALRKEKLNTNRDIWRVSINWLGGTKKRKNGIQTNGNDEDSVIIVD